MLPQVLKKYFPIAYILYFDLPVAILAYRLKNKKKMPSFSVHKFLCLTSFQIFELEKDLSDALKAAGKPSVVPKHPVQTKDITLTQKEPTLSKRPEIKPVDTEAMSELSSDSEASSPEISPGTFNLFAPTS